MIAQSVKESRGSYLADAAKELVATASESSFDTVNFIEKFELLVDIPSAIQCFRELIIENCILGKFTKTGEGECVAVKYLLEPPIASCRTNWRTLNFGKYCDIQGGNQPPKSDFIDQPKDGYIRLLQIRDLGDKPVPTYIPIESTNRFCTDGDILIGRYGASVGKIFWAKPGAYNVALAKFIYPTDAYHPAYAFWLLKSAVFQRRVLASNRSAQAGFNKGDLASIDFPLPPLAEQKRIVAKVDELMALCDRLASQHQQREEQSSKLARASLARFAAAPTPANLNYLFHSSFSIHPSDLRKCILTLAVQGKLVPQDPNEPVEADYQSLIKTRESSSLKRTKIDGEINVKELSIPSSWIGVSLGELVSIRTGFAFKSEDYAENGTLILRVTNISPNGTFDTSNSVFLPQSKLDEKMRAFLLEEHEILVVMVGGSLGKIGQVSTEILPALLNQNMWRLKPYSDRLDNRFLRLVLNDLNENRLQITQSTHGHLAMGTYAASKVPFPPLAEQKRIVAKVDELMAIVDQLEQQLAHSRTLGQQLLEAVVDHLTNATAPTEAV